MGSLPAIVAPGPVLCWFSFHLLMLSVSGFGTKRTSGDVRSSVAIGGKPDMARTRHFGSDRPISDIRRT